MRRYKTKLDLV